MADLAILAAGPQWTGYYWYTIFNATYTILEVFLPLIAYSVSWTDSNLKEKGIVWKELTDGGLLGTFMIGAIGIVILGGPLTIYFLIALFAEGIFQAGMGFFGGWAMSGIVFFNIFLSYWEELVFLIVASGVTIVSG
jgi:hypothetical protein